MSDQQRLKLKPEQSVDAMDAELFDILDSPFLPVAFKRVMLATWRGRRDDIVAALDAATAQAKLWESSNV